MPSVPTALFGDEKTLARVYAQNRTQRLAAASQLYPHIITAENFAENLPDLAQIEAIFTTWGFARFSPAQLEQLPNLKAVFYAAGSVQNFARPLLERGITVISAWAANGVPVAEWTLGQILLANKGFFRNNREFVAPQSRTSHGRGNFGAEVAILGAGQIGRRVIEFLRPFDLKILVFDPFLSEESAQSLGVEKVGLEAAFSRGNVVSNHLANLPTTVGLLNGALFDLLLENATFINTGRGATVNEPDLIQFLQNRPDATALLDVTDPEPPLENSPLYTLKNVFLTRHIAGSIGDEVVRMADYVLEEFEAWKRGGNLRYGVTLEMLETMA